MGWEFAFMLCECTGVGLVGTNRGPMPCLKALVHVGAALTVVSLSACGADGAVNGTLPEAGFNLSFEAAQKHVPKSVWFGDDVKYAMRDASNRIGDGGDVGDDHTWWRGGTSWRWRRRQGCRHAVPRVSVETPLLFME